MSTIPAYLTLINERPILMFIDEQKLLPFTNAHKETYKYKTGFSPLVAHA
jgi:hypothetical protein